MFISIDRVRENAVTFKTEFISEIYRVVFHGILHLTGYNDKSEVEKMTMRNKEEYYLARSGF